MVGPDERDGRNLGVRFNIVRPAASDLPEGESLLATPEFVARLMRVAQLWHYVLIARVLAFFAFAFFPGCAGDRRPAQQET